MIPPPKDKAKELVNKMTGFTFDDCKYNALIAVELVLEELHFSDTDYNLIGRIDYYSKVKQKIEKL
jgi:hypothetical protein